MITFVVVLLSIVSLILFFEQRRGITRHGKKLPRPPGTLPLAGYGLWFLQPRHKLLRWFAEMQPRMGLTTYELPVPSLPPAVLINDPVNLEFVLKDTDVFVKGDFFQSRSWDLFANGILNADGDLWRTQRKAGLRFLSNANLRYFIDDILPPILEDLRSRLREASLQGSIIDLQQELLVVTTRLFGRVAYDMDIDPSMPFSAAFERASAGTNSRFTNPFWRIQDRLVGGSFRSAVAEVKAFGRAVVATADKKQQGRSSRVSPLQTTLIESLLHHIPDRQVVADATTNFLSAGRDTTAQTISWTMYELMKDAKALHRTVESIEKQFPGLHRGQQLPITFDAAIDPHFLTYVNAAFAEALRLNPAVPLEIKETTSLCTLPDGTSLPAGAAVVWMPFAMARSPAIWGPNASEFIPERWIQKDEQGQDVLVQKSAFENPVFNAGPRMCIGKRMAEVLAVKLVAELCWNWSFSHVGSREIVVGESLTAPMQGGFPVDVRLLERISSG